LVTKKTKPILVKLAKNITVFKQITDAYVSTNKNELVQFLILFFLFLAYKHQLL